MKPTIGIASTMDGYPWGGSEELWAQSARHLLKQGTPVVSYTAHWAQPAPQLAALRQEGLNSATWVRRNRLARTLGRTLEKDFDRWLNTARPSLVVISQGHHFGGQEWMQTCAKRGIPYAIIVQAVVPYWPGDDRVESCAAAYEQAKAVFFVSEANRDSVRRQFASLLPNSQVVRNPVNVAYDADPPYPSSDAGYRLACVARLEIAAKGQDVLLAVLGQPKWKARPISVSLYGKGANEKTLTKLCKLYDLSNVTFAGHTADIEQVWATHHALILPSRFEGLPLALVEAALCSRTAIVTDVDGNTELLQDNETVFVAPAPLPKYLDEAMERAWQRRTEWQRMGQAAACSVRRQIPPDPAAVFAEELSRLLNPNA